MRFHEPDETPLVNFLAKVCSCALALVALLFMFGMIGCATAPKTPAQSVYALKGGFSVALRVAVAYESLPQCGTGPPICSEYAVKVKIAQGANKANAALDVAETAVRKGVASPATIAAAEAAVYEFQGLTSSLKVQ